MFHSLRIIQGFVRFCQFVRNPSTLSQGSTTTGDAVYFNIELINLAESMSSSALDQLGQFLTRVEHAGLHRGGGNAEYLRALIDRLLVIVHEVNDFPMFEC